MAPGRLLHCRVPSEEKSGESLVAGRGTLLPSAGAGRGLIPHAAAPTRGPVPARTVSEVRL